MTSWILRAEMREEVDDDVPTISTAKLGSPSPLAARCHRLPRQLTRITPQLNLPTVPFPRSGRLDPVQPCRLDTLFQRLADVRGSVYDPNPVGRVECHGEEYGFRIRISSDEDQGVFARICGQRVVPVVRI